jgi:hypothetical protein
MSRDEKRLIKREFELTRIFKLGSSEMECFRNFEEAEAFVERIGTGKVNFIILGSSLKKVQQIFILSKTINSQSLRPNAISAKLHDIHLVN